MKRRIFDTPRSKRIEHGAIQKKCFLKLFFQSKFNINETFLKCSFKDNR